MRFRRFLLVFIICFLFISGCSKRVLVPYNSIEETNTVKIVLTSGERVFGTVVKTEPHQLVVIQRDLQKRIIRKSLIRSIRRKPPVYDDFNRGISEKEIRSVQKFRNKTIFGIGGGFLSFGVGFFVGSLTGQVSNQGFGTLVATTAAIGGLGTVLFINSGKKRDRYDAIAKIREQRRLDELKKREKKDTQVEIFESLEEEKIKQEKLRREREQILRELNKTD
jgi:hypothetical protein